MHSKITDTAHLLTLHLVHSHEDETGVRQDLHTLRWQLGQGAPRLKMKPNSSPQQAQPRPALAFAVCSRVVNLRLASLESTKAMAGKTTLVYLHFANNEQPLSWSNGMGHRTQASTDDSQYMYTNLLGVSMWARTRARVCVCMHARACVCVCVYVLVNIVMEYRTLAWLLVMIGTRVLLSSQCLKSIVTEKCSQSKWNI